MPIPPKKLKAFVDEDKKKKKNVAPEDEEMDEGEGTEEEGEAEGAEGPDADGDRHLSEEETQALLEKAEKEVENGPDGALSDAMMGYDGSGEPPLGFDSDVWEAATEIVGPEDYQGESDPWLVVAHVYKALGGKMPGGDEDESGGEMPEDEGSESEE